MMTSYKVVGNVGGVLLTLRSHYAARQPWCQCKVRKETSCAVTGVTIAAGSQAWRPIDNSVNRMQRISLDGMKRLVDAG